MRKAHALYLEKNPGMPVGFSAFCKLKSDRVWFFRKVPVCSSFVCAKFMRTLGCFS